MISSALPTDKICHAFRLILLLLHVTWLRLRVCRSGDANVDVSIREHQQDDSKKMLVLMYCVRRRFKGTRNESESEKKRKLFIRTLIITVLFTF